MTRAECVLRDTAPAELLETRRWLNTTLSGARSAFELMERLPQPDPDGHAEARENGFE